MPSFSRLSSPTTSSAGCTCRIRRSSPKVKSRVTGSLGQVTGWFMGRSREFMDANKNKQGGWGWVGWGNGVYSGFGGWVVGLLARFRASMGSVGYHRWPRNWFQPTLDGSHPKIRLQVLTDRSRLTFHPENHQRGIFVREAEPALWVSNSRNKVNFGIKRMPTGVGAPPFSSRPIHSFQVEVVVWMNPKPSRCASPCWVMSTWVRSQTICH